MVEELESQVTDLGAAVPWMSDGLRRGALSRTRKAILVSGKCVNAEQQG